MAVNREGLEVEPQVEGPDLGVYMFMSLGFTVLIGCYLAAYHAAWCTLAGALVGAGLAFLLRLVAASPFLAGIVARLTRPFRALIHSRSSFFEWLICRATLGKVRCSEGVETFARIRWLHRQFWARLKEVSPKTARVMVMGAVIRPLAHYAQWLAIGILFACLRLERGAEEATVQLQISLQLNLSLGFLFGLITLRDVLRAKLFTDSAEASEIVPLRLARELEQLEQVGELSPQDSAPTLARFHRAVRKNSWAIGGFVRNAVAIQENYWGLFLGLAVLFWVCWWAAFIALFAVMLLIPLRTFELWAIKRAQDKLVIPRLVLDNLQHLAEDVRINRLLDVFLEKGRFVGGLNQSREFLASCQKEIRTTSGWHQGSARIIFFSLFSISCVLPTLALLHQELAFRPFMLYVFSMVGLWLNVQTVTEKTSKLIFDLGRLDEVEEALEALSETAPAASNATRPKVSLSSSIKVAANSKFGYPGRKLLLWCPKELTHQAVITEVESRLVVIGAPRSGSSTLLRLLAGELKPTSGTIEIGDQASSNLDLRPWVKLIGDTIPEFPRIKIGELFRAVVGQNMADTEIEQLLELFGLLSEIKVEGSEDYTGLNLLIGHNGRYLTEEQSRLLFLALHYAVLKERAKKEDFRPAVIAVDGVHKVRPLLRRLQIAQLFRKLCDQLHSSLLTVVRDLREIEDSDQVILLVSQDQAPAEYQDQEFCKTLVFGYDHGARWRHTDRHKRAWYRNWHQARRDEN